MAQLGLNVQQIGSTMNLAFAGNTDLQYSEAGNDYSIACQLDQFDRTNLEDVGSLTFLNSKNNPVELRNFASISQSLGANKLERYNRMSSLTVKCNVLDARWEQ